MDARPEADIDAFEAEWRRKRYPGLASQSNGSPDQVKDVGRRAGPQLAVSSRHRADKAYQGEVQQRSAASGEFLGSKQLRKLHAAPM